jgi:hypothetical protein
LDRLSTYLLASRKWLAVVATVDHFDFLASAIAIATA